MPYTTNDEYVKRGLLPVPRIADKLGKPRSTFHRMVDRGSVAGALDGRQCYVSIQSLIEYYTTRGQHAQAAKCRELERELCGSNEGSSAPE